MKPWYNVIKPREDLTEGKPLDASEFALHLDHVRDGRGADVCRNPQEFFERCGFKKTPLEPRATRAEVDELLCEGAFPVCDC